MNVTALLLALLALIGGANAAGQWRHGRKLAESSDDTGVVTAEDGGQVTSLAAKAPFLRNLASTSKFPYRTCVAHSRDAVCHLSEPTSRAVGKDSTEYCFDFNCKGCIPNPAVNPKKPKPDETTVCCDALNKMVYEVKLGVKGVCQSAFDATGGKVTVNGRDKFLGEVHYDDLKKKSRGQLRWSFSNVRNQTSGKVIGTTYQYLNQKRFCFVVKNRDKCGDPNFIFTRNQATGMVEHTTVESSRHSCCPTPGRQQQQQRVRKELRALTPEEYKLFLQGIAVMSTVDSAVGQALYGPAYREYEYFVVKHAVASQDPRGDQGHMGPCFMTFHRALLLEFEASLLAVVPALKAMPYWDLTLDMAGGRFHGTNSSFFSPLYAGDVDGDASANYTVTRGALAWRRVGTFNAAKYGHVAHIYSGSTTTGLLRSATNTNPNPYVTRYPAANLGLYVNVTNGMAAMAAMAAGLDWPFTHDNFTATTDAAAVADWKAWNTVIEDTFFHPAGHWIVGGASTTDTAVNLGDVMDVTTSPNEPILFMTHHANVDRSNMIWMRNALARNASMADPDVMWGYPVRPNASSPSPPSDRIHVDGCYLHDVITSNFGFTDLDLMFPSGVSVTPPASPLGYTHLEVLAATTPSASTYTYDVME